MTAPQPGDRVKVTFDAVVISRGHSTHVAPNDGVAVRVPLDATVEVLPQPVYANHDTTEYRVGDVVRDSHGEVGVRDADGDWFVVGRGFVSVDLTEPRTLLVRDGQVIA